MVGDNFLDNTYNAIMLVTDFPVKDLYSITNVHFKDIQVDGTGTRCRQRPVGRLGARSRTWTPATSAAAASTTAARSTSPPTGSEFTLTDLGGNDGIDNDATTPVPLARPLGPAEHHHLQRPAAGRRAAGTVGLVEPPVW